MPRVVYLSISAAEVDPHRIEAFRQGLGEYGYVEGHHIAVEYRFANDDQEQLRGLVAEVVGLQPDVIVVQSTVGALAVQEATNTIPIVASSGDAVGTGLVASLARPGGNVTGVSSLAPSLSGKRLQLLADVVAGLSRVAVLWYAEGPAPRRAYQETEAAAHVLGVELLSMPVRGAEEFESAFDAALRERAEALLQIQGPVVNSNPRRVVDFTTQHRLPAMSGNRAFVEAGGLMAYSVEPLAQDRRLAYYVDRILKGTSPADLPVEQPTTFEFVINLRTAEALGLTIPQQVLLQTTETIQ
jgi:putative ABC transport system substrate-binding protein